MVKNLLGADEGYHLPEKLNHLFQFNGKRNAPRNDQTAGLVINIPGKRSLDTYPDRINRSNDLNPEDLTKSFYYRAYFNMGSLGDIFVRLGITQANSGNYHGYG